MPDINNIFQELKKRKVFRSLAIYAAASFIILQVCSIVFPALLLPEWSMRLIVVLLIIGFPALIIFSWIYDVTPEGVIKTDSGKSSSNTNYSTLILILVVVGGLIFYFQDRLFKPVLNPKSVAVLPFDNYSPNPDDKYLSAGFTEVIIANLAKVQDLLVISRTSVMRYQDTEMSLKEIAKELNVANILEGSIQRNGNKIRVVGQLIEAKTDKHLWAETYDADFEDIFSISGRGTVATGRIETGVIKVGEEVEIVGFRDTTKTTITGVEMFRKLLDEGVAGDNVGVLLRGTEKDDVERGQVLAKPGSITPHTKFKGEVYVLTKDEGGRHTPFFNGYRPQFYLRTTDVTGVATLPEGVEMVMPGDNVTVAVELITPVALETGLRFAIREGGRTVGAGTITEIVE